MFKAKKDADKKVLGSKMITPNDLEQFEEVNNYFVDSSGWGRKGDPALTLDEFLKKIKVGRFYAITGVGQFQVHVGEFIKKEEKND